MLEMLLSPRKATRRPWEMLILGIFYGSLSMLLAEFMFSQDTVLNKYTGILVVVFSVMFTLPFLYFLIKRGVEKEIGEKDSFRLFREHSRTILALLFLFAGFVIAFSFWHLLLGAEYSLMPQIETYCAINRPGQIENCVQEYGFGGDGITGFATSGERAFAIFTNNMYVLIFTILFSLIFGAGAIFILAWNASVIAAAIGVFSKNLSCLHCGFLRYVLHGLPEIAAYFIAAIAGGLVSIAIIRHGTSSDKFWKVLQDALILVLIAVPILIAAALIEVYITPGIVEVLSNSFCGRCF